jgi:hypothetical protein
MPVSPSRPPDAATLWPPLAYEPWRATLETLHMWTQIVGKVRLARAPTANHWWHASLYVTARGLTTSPMPAGAGTFEITFDLLADRLLVETSGGATRVLELAPRTVADFYHELMDTLRGLGLETRILARPVEVVEAIPFARDTVHASYDAEAVRRFFAVLVQAARALAEFRCGFVGKASPVQFFWGSFDLAVTRFSGRPAPLHPGGAPNVADWVMQEAYSHEVSSCGFWPGGEPLPEPVFYAYGYPEPDGFARARVRPAAARYHEVLREFVLPYEAVRAAAQPAADVLAFCESTYEAAAELGRWDRAALERRSAGSPAQAGARTAGA